MLGGADFLPSLCLFLSSQRQSCPFSPQPPNHLSNAGARLGLPRLTSPTEWGVSSSAYGSVLPTVVFRP